MGACATKKRDKEYTINKNHEPSVFDIQGDEENAVNKNDEQSSVDTQGDEENSVNKNDEPLSVHSPSNKEHPVNTNHEQSSVDTQGDEENSVNKNVLTPKWSMPSLRKNILPFDERLYDPFSECLFQYLGIKDLLMLSLVSQKFHFEVEVYCKGLYKSVQKVLNAFFESQMILIEEANVQQELKEGDHKFKWEFLTAVKLNRVYRKSVTQFSMPHLGNPSYIIRKYDDNLGREIVLLKTVCWLHFTHTFPGVLRGKYRASLRMDITNVNWPSHPGTAKIRIYWEDLDGFQEKKAEIKWDKWRELRRDLKTDKTVIKFGGGSACNYELRGGWFDFCLEEFTINETCEVKFEFKDIENSWWKSGMRWDYVELRPIDWVTQNKITME